MIGTFDTQEENDRFNEYLKKRKPMRNKQSESQLQSECVRWFRYQYPEYRLLLFSIPNGGKRNISTAKRLKAEGVVSGVADLFLAVPCQNDEGEYNWLGYFIEMKYAKGKQTESQIEFQKEVEHQAYKYSTCNSFDDFKELIENYLE